MSTKPSLLTEEQVKEMKEWLDAHIDQMPATLQMNAYTFYENLPQTARYLMEVVEEHWEDRYFIGYFSRLVDIRRKLQGEEVL